jgi:hypothetical protein
MNGFFTPKIKDDPLAEYGANMARGLKKAGLSLNDIVYSQILPTAGAMVPNQAQVVSSLPSYHEMVTDDSCSLRRH